VSDGDGDGDAAAVVVVVCTALCLLCLQIPLTTVLGTVLVPGMDCTVRYHHQKQFALSLLRSFYAVAVGGSSWAVERAY
jgi:hypothetical protein